MESLRKPFEGVFNIIRFNWPLYFWALFLSTAGLAVNYFDFNNSIAGLVLGFFPLLVLLISLLVSYYVYDFSPLYSFRWLKSESPAPGLMINIHAGFDETSALLQQIYPDAKLYSLDFYNPLLHTEPSIRRARNIRAPYAGTIAIDPLHIPLATSIADKVFIIFAAHEMRKEEERVLFFKEVHRLLKNNGEVLVTEHLRDVPNFIAYSVGSFHFYSRALWKRTFSQADFTIKKQTRITAFVTTFILQKNGTAP